VQKTLTAVLFTLAVSACFVGCMGKVKYPSYYTLNLPPAPDPPVQEGTHASLAIQEFRSAGYLRQGAIVYRATPEQIGFYDYHRWAIDPRQFVTNAVADRLRASGKFTQVKIYDGRSDVDYILRGRLEKLEELDYEGGAKVEVALSAQMIDVRTGVTVWSNEVSDVGTVAQRNVAGVVSEMNHTMDRAIEKLLTPSLASATARGK